MLQSDILKSQKNSYRNCYKQVVQTANELAAAINELNEMINIQGSCYNVNDVNGGTNYLSHLLEKERSIYNNIVNNILPDINSKIENLNYRVNDALQQEALESEA